MDNIKEIEALVSQILPVCEEWIKEGEDKIVSLIDPIDGEEISAHYGVSHTAAAFIIWGKMQNELALYNKGILLLKSTLFKWNTITKMSSFHFDFNNFALCLIFDTIDDEMLKTQIKDVICSTADSNHSTINWLPMRSIVNRKRLEWTGDIKYKKAIFKCKKLIAESTNSDGGIEDRLPHGMSYNLQYNVATVATLQLLRREGENQDLTQELGFLLNAVAPDGDINYLGRGANQVFAWGMWVYLLASSGQQNELEHALAYLAHHLPQMLLNQSMMLNEWKGEDKYLWWDYHYTSVYTAHSLLWLVLAIRDYGKAGIEPRISDLCTTGVHIFRSSEVFVSWFDGRKEYLAENGPAIAAIWIKKHGLVCKGTFGPWQGLFGKKYLYEGVVIKNFCGLVGIKRNKDWSKNRVMHRLFPKLNSVPKFTLQPVFCSISVESNCNEVVITWVFEGSLEVIFNLPTYSRSFDFVLNVDGKIISTACVEAIRNQYSWVYLQQSKATKGRVWKLMINK